MTRLTQTTLPAIREQPYHVSLPHYDRRVITPGFVHLGVGGVSPGA